MSNNKLLRLFLSMLYISTFTFGGGFVIITFMKRKFVDELHWIDEPEMLDLAALAQSSPGAIAVNAAILVGWRVAGAAGIVSAVIGTILPPMAIISVISLFYEQFRTNPYIATALQVMRAGVAAVIFDVVINLAGNVFKTRRILYITMMLAAFTAACFLGVSAMLIIPVCLGIGLIDLFLTWKRKSKEA